MSGALRAVLLLTVAVGFSFAVAILAWTRVDASRGPAGRESGPAGAEVDAHSSATLAARYHLRKRTTRFFDRVKRSSSTRRPSPGLLTPRKRGRHASAAMVDDRWLAGRYHLRKRTSRFYRRTVG